MVNQSDRPHAFLFSGASGSGKTTMARILAANLGATGHDVTEINAADSRGIDTIREIQNDAPFAPMRGGARVWIFDEAHRLSKDAQNAFLKLLEEPPQHSYFIICTTEPKGLLTTVVNRCVALQVTPLGEHEMMRLLRHVTKQEGDSLSKSVYREIAQASGGVPRKALGLLEKVLAMDPSTREQAIVGADEEPAEVIDLCRAIAKHQPWKAVAACVSQLQDHDTEAVRRAVLAYFAKALVGQPKGDDRAAAVLEAFSEPFYSGYPSLVLAAYTAIHE